MRATAAPSNYFYSRGTKKWKQKQLRKAYKKHKHVREKESESMQTYVKEINEKACEIPIHKEANGNRALSSQDSPLELARTQPMWVEAS